MQEAFQDRTPIPNHTTQTRINLNDKIMYNQSQSKVTVNERSDGKVIDVVLPNGKPIEIIVKDNGTVMVMHNAFDPELKKVIARLDRVTVEIESDTE